MNLITPAICTELQGLQGSAIEKWLIESLRDLDEKSRCAKNEIDFRWLQGRAQQLQEWIEAIQGADVRMMNMKEKISTQSTRRPMQGAF